MKKFLFLRLFKDNTAKILILLLDQLKISCSFGLIKALMEHPKYPVLESFSHALQKKNVSSIPMRASLDDLKHYPKPIVCACRNAYNEEELKIITRTHDNSIEVLDDRNTRLKYSSNEFFKEYQGIALLMKKSEETSSSPRSFSDVKPLFVVLLVVFIPILWTLLNWDTLGLFGIYDILFSINSLLGVVVTLLIVQHVHKDSRMLSKFCTSENNQFDCDDLLKSEASKVFGLIKLTSISLVYFLFLLLLNLCSFNDSLSISSILAFVGFSFPFYSVYYQWRIVKRWCKLCLIVQGLLLTNFVIGLLYSLETNLAFEKINWIPLFLMLVVLILVVMAYERYLVVSSRLDKYKEATKIKFDRKIFQFALSKQPKIDTSEFIVLNYGNLSNYRDEITIIANPRCKECKNVYRELNRFVHHKRRVKVSEVIYFPYEDSKDLEVIEKILKSYQNRQVLGKEIIHLLNYQQLLDWSDTPSDLDAMETQHLVDNNINTYKKFNFTKTPVILFNGHVLPEYYTIQDLDYLTF
jgi:uncharacterized membrane protein